MVGENVGPFPADENALKVGDGQAPHYERDAYEMALAALGCAPEKYLGCEGSERLFLSRPKAIA